MTTTDTRDVAATVEQVKKCADAGADLVRLTVQGMQEAKACKEIREELFRQGYTVPLVADIHFQPKVALLVAEAWEKIRVNPGNFADGTKSFEEMVYETEEDFRKGRDEIARLFVPLVLKCKELGRAMRIGANHGSLSARVLSYYGDTPKGMVESAIEFAEICREHDYHNFVFSMKASNPLVMVQAYRLLAARMYELGWDYPLHLGVTEAGEGEDGRMKSAIGIGALLEDGLGDTIRVSLTEDPDLELPPCATLARRMDKVDGTLDRYKNIPQFDDRRNIEIIANRKERITNLSNYLHRDGSVMSVVDPVSLDSPDSLYQALACKMVVGVPFKEIATSDSIYLTGPVPDSSVARVTLRRLIDSDIGVLVALEHLRAAPVSGAVAVVSARDVAGTADGVAADAALASLESILADVGCEKFALRLDGSEGDELLRVVLKAAEKSGRAIAIIFHIEDDLARVHSSRRLFQTILDCGIGIPVVHSVVAKDGEGVEGREQMVMRIGSEIGGLLVDG